METRDRYDQLRLSIPRILPPNRLVMTRGVAELGDGAVDGIMREVREFKDFTPDNDPWGEHDFGSFIFNGEKIFWKIDDHRGVDGLQLVLTVMLAGEY